ncbi:MAG: hypothetical protein K2X47_05875 [Bdellovibrionales bacterium]|nr:hypothetical protein [Bdellovibrionales bacterium]
MNFSSKKILGMMLLWILFGAAVAAAAGNKLDLEDVDIKGELHNDDRLVIIARERNELRNHVKLRTNFRREITEALPLPARSVPTEAISK